MNCFDDSWIPTQHISTLLLEYVSFFFPKLPPAFYFTESNPWSTHAPPTVWANLNLPAVSVFSHPHDIQDYSTFTQNTSRGLLPFLPSSCAHVFLSLTHTPGVNARTSPFLESRDLFRHQCWLAVTFSRRHAAPVIFRSHYLGPVLSHTNRPGHVLQPAWLMSNCLDTAYSLQCATQQWTDDLDMRCFAFCVDFNAELNGPA